jgi:hypothetical protein
MGTNFYVSIKGLCPHCKEGIPELAQTIHLGKRSAGWKFNLQLNNEKYYKNWQEMKEWLKDKEIVNEYCDSVALNEFIGMVEELKDEDESWYWKIAKIKDNSIYIDGYKFSDYEFS